jgi:hypothetical protein
VYDIALSYGKGKTISNLGNGTAIISISYSPAKKEASGSLYAAQIDTKGKATRITDSAYDTNSGCVIFTTTHFSKFGVGYTAANKKASDISSHWAKEAIDYVVGRGLLTGTSDTTFSPDAAMTRGMLVMALGKLAGVDTKLYTTSSYTDMNADNTYRPYAEWAHQKGIIQTANDKQFAPDQAVTRQEAAVILANYAKATGYTLPVICEVITFTDNSSIGSAYQDAVKKVQQAGIMMGGNGNKFNPKSEITRAELSFLLHRYIMLTIDPVTTQGWVLNHSGQYIYYKYGILATDQWLEIDGKWYYVYSDGSLARSTKIGDYEVDENGVRKTSKTV